MSENTAKKWPQYLAATCICFGAVGTGTALGWSSNILQDLEEGKLNDFKMSREEISWAISMMPLGAMVVCIPIGLISNAVGRKLTALITIIPFIVGWLLIMFSQGIMMLYAGRFLTGIAGGAFCVIAPLYTSEIAEPEIRARLGAFFYLFMAIGILYAGVLGHMATMMVYHSLLLVIPVISGAVFLFQPETPVYLIRKRKDDKLPISYKKLRGKDYDPSEEINATKEQVAKERPGFFGGMQTKAARKATMICFLLMFFHQSSEITIIFCYLRNTTFIEDEWYPEWSVIGLGIVQVVATAGTCINIKETRRQKLLEDSVLGAAVFSGAVMIFLLIRMDGTYTFDRLVCLAELFLAFFIAAGSHGLGPIPWLAPYELLPPEGRVGGGSAAATFGWFIAFFLTKCHFMFTTDGHFAFIMVVTLIAYFFIRCCVPETKGKTFKEIQVKLGGTGDDE